MAIIASTVCKVNVEKFVLCKETADIAIRMRTEVIFSQKFSENQQAYDY